MARRTPEGLPVISEKSVRSCIRDAWLTSNSGRRINYQQSFLKKIEQENPGLYTFCQNQKSTLEHHEDLSRYNAFVGGVMAAYQLFAAQNLEDALNDSLDEE